LGGAINVGNIFTGNFSYNLNTVDSNPDQTVGDYWHYSAPYGISVTINGLTFKTDPTNTEFLVELVNRATDNIVLHSYNNIFPVSMEMEHISWQLDDFSGNVLSNTNLPSSLDLSSWTQDFGLTISAENMIIYKHYSIRAVVDSVACLDRETNCITCEDCSAKLNGGWNVVKLQSNIFDVSGTCIQFGANDVVFDCQGHTIDGDDSGEDYGIYLNGVSGNTIKNCVITDFARGIHLSSSSRNTLTNNTANSNVKYGITLYTSSNNNLLTNNTVNNNNIHGIVLYTSSNNNLLTGNTANNNYYTGINIYTFSNNITGNTANSNQQGIFLQSSSNNTISGNKANSNFQIGEFGGIGIYLNTSSNNTLINNIANSNVNIGIELNSYSNNNILTGNTANNNIVGIELEYYSKNNLLTSNIANNNNNVGIFLYISLNNTLTNNIANNDTYRGIELSNSSNNILTNNTANSSQQYGILLYDDHHNPSNNNIFTGNIVSSNQGYGIWLEYSCSNNIIYNNYFNNLANALDNGNNFWNTAKTLGKNIVGGPYLGGNYWTNSTNNGYSNTCTDANGDGFCDTPYIVRSNNIDYLPIANYISGTTTTTTSTTTTTVISVDSDGDGVPDSKDNCPSVYNPPDYKKITIKEKSGKTLTDYQVLLTIDTKSLISNGIIRTDCKNIIFNDSTGSEIFYWVESGCNTPETKIWVKVPRIPASSDTTIYMKYGNLGFVNPKNNADNTFLFFDDFNDGIYTDKWNVNSPGISITESGGVITLKSGPGEGNEAIILSLNQLSGQGGIILEDRAQMSSPGSVVMLWLGTSKDRVQYKIEGGNYYTYMSGDNFGADFQKEVGPATSNWMFYQGKLYSNKWSGSRGSSYGVWDRTDTLDLGSSAEGFSYYVIIYTWGTGELKVDWIRVRKYASVEPTIQVESLQSDTDGDGIGDACDNCRSVPNWDQTDSNDNCPKPPYTSDPLCGDACECLGDLNNDRVVNILDISIIARAFGSRPGDEKWNPIADIDNNNLINILDIAKVAREFGKVC
jgi:parallel beta-helix repeat protein